MPTRKHGGFSRSDGPGLSRSSGAAGPSGPNSVPRNCDLRFAFHSAPRCSCTCGRCGRFAQLVSVPPLSNHLETFARAMALHTEPRGAGVKVLLRKEVIQPHLPVRLPCYDFVPIADPTFDGSLPRVGPPASGVTDFRDVTGGVYKARERIHRSNADLRLLATPTSRGRVADPDPN